ncbi:hypothetical protein [Hymenobacter sp. ISL-91]|uniref:hypothetical protein n=1 Tax=Hymenobacter sp. ISL-91 TaxID=2819151 RepID=UPI001BE7D67A|nr:hypothetical protein [Hymenobacter sp. ISL-91]
MHTNAMEVTNLRNNRTIYRESTRKFSIDRLPIADFFVAEQHLKQIIAELREPGWIKPSIDFLMQFAVNLDGGISAVEKKTLREMGEYSGGVTVFIAPYAQKLTDEQALQKLLLGLKGKSFMPPDLVT